MTRKYILASILFLFFAALADLSAQVSENNEVNFAYDVAFDMNFDNREFYRSRFSRSMTIFGARLTPSLGISIRQHNDVSHKVMLGIDVMKDFGASPVVSQVADADSPETHKSLNNKDLFNEVILYYQMRKKAGNNLFSIDAGIFPRTFMQGRIPKHSFPIRSDSMITISKESFSSSNVPRLLSNWDATGWGNTAPTGGRGSWCSLRERGRSRISSHWVIRPICIILQIQDRSMASSIIFS